MWTLPCVHERFVNAPIKLACANFSNRRADRVLYLKDDEVKLGWTQDEISIAVERILNIQALFEAHGKKFIYVVAPDKSTVYQHCLLSGHLATATLPNVTESLIAAGVNTPDLLRYFKEKSAEVVDLYKPDDTHLSDKGFMLLSEEIKKTIAAADK